MRVLLLLVAVAFAWAEAGDDATYCVDECVKKYETEDTNSTTEKAQCLEGCQFRTAPSGDSMGFEVFKKCHLRCKEEKNDNSPCHYACALPYTSMVVMKYEYDSRNGDAPRVSVVSSQGGSAALSKLSQILGLKAKDIKDEEEDWFDDEEGDDEDVEEGLKKSKAGDLFDGQDEMMRMHQKFERLFADFRRRFFNDDELLKNFAEERPHDHDAFANHGPSVGNVDDDGHEIIFASPRDFNDDSVEFRKSQAETPSGGRRIVLEWEQRLRRFPALLQWAVCAVLLVAIAATLAVTFLVMRQMKLNRYRVLQAQPPVVLSAEAGPLPTKKVPLVNEWEEAEGTPPPAYDQLSVHSKQNANDDQV